MKKIVLGCAFTVASLATSTAFAECCFPPTCDPGCFPQSCDPCCFQDFNGLYVGGNVGVASLTTHLADFDGFFTGGGRSNTDTNVTAGVLLGYDWQCNSRLLGVVADWDWTNVKIHIPNGTGHIRNRLDWITTIRGRAGLTICDALAYVTLGAAVHRVCTRANGTDITGSVSDSHTRWGWVGGAGVEFLLGCNWSVGTEVLFLNFNDRKTSFTDATGVTYRFAESANAFIGRIILNYRFGNLFCF